MRSFPPPQALQFCLPSFICTSPHAAFCLLTHIHARPFYWPEPAVQPLEAATPASLRSRILLSVGPCGYDGLRCQQLQPGLACARLPARVQRGESRSRPQTAARELPKAWRGAEPQGAWRTAGTVCGPGLLGMLWVWAGEAGSPFVSLLLGGTWAGLSAWAQTALLRCLPLGGKFQ